MNENEIESFLARVRNDAGTARENPRSRSCATLAELNAHVEESRERYWDACGNFWSRDGRAISRHGGWEGWQFCEPWLEPETGQIHTRPGEQVTDEDGPFLTDIH